MTTKPRTFKFYRRQNNQFSCSNFRRYVKKKRQNKTIVFRRGNIIGNFINSCRFSLMCAVTDTLLARSLNQNLQFDVQVTVNQCYIHFLILLYLTTEYRITLINSRWEITNFPQSRVFYNVNSSSNKIMTNYSVWGLGNIYFIRIF